MRICDVDFSNNADLNHILLVEGERGKGEEKNKKENKMREIKFRGRRKDDGEWVYGSYIIYKDEAKFIVNECERKINTYINGKPFYTDYKKQYEIIPNTLGQYTGLIDINGKEIYEGDIVEKKSIEYLFNNEEKITIWRGVVKYIAPKFIYKNKDGYYLAGTSGFEVIGNVYENPELLKNEF